MTSVKYSGPWSESSGYASANRNIIQSLHESGVDVVTELQVYAKQETDYGYQHELAKSLQEKHHNYPIKVLHITPNVYSKHKEVGKYHIGHLFWETTKMSKTWEWYLNEVREIWTGCEYNVECFKNAGFEGKIFKFPQPVDVSRTGTKLPIEHAEGFIFGSVFQWIERKDPRSLLTAYWREFQNDQNVTLVIKSYGMGFSEQESRRIRKEILDLKNELNLPKYPKTLLIDYLLSDQDIHDFYESCDCMVFSHRGEGWHVPGAESLVHKKPLISPNLGGIYEWLSEDAYFPVSYSMTDVANMDWAEQYIIKGNKWGQVNTDDLQKKMRFVYENRQKASEVAEQGHKEAVEKFNFKSVGQMMKNRLVEIYKEQKFS